MNKEEYYKRIERINDKFKTDRVSTDEEYQLVCQKNYLSIKYTNYNNLDEILTNWFNDYSERK